MNKILFSFLIAAALPALSHAGDSDRYHLIGEDGSLETYESYWDTPAGIEQKKHLENGGVKLEDKSCAMFKRNSLGLGFGTSGFTLNYATAIGQHFELRIQANAMINVHPVSQARACGLQWNDNEDSQNSAWVSRDGYAIPTSMGMRSVISNMSANAILSYYPSKSSGFFIAAGVGYGNRCIGKWKSLEPAEGLYQYNQAHPGNEIGMLFGRSLIYPNRDGDMTVKYKVSQIRPYLGIGWGRCVPRKSVNFQVELGAQYWGHPKGYCNGRRIYRNGPDGAYSGSTPRFISSLPFCPTLTVRINWRCQRILPK